MPELLPIFDIGLDFDGEPIIGSSGFVLITDEDLIKQYIKGLFFTQFNARSYIGLPNEEATGILFKQEITDMLTSDILLASINLTPLIDVYPTNERSLAFQLVLTNNNGVTIDMGEPTFLNLRSGVLIGYGEYSMSNDIYDFNKSVIRYERVNLIRASSIFYLSHIAKGINSIRVARVADIVGFDNNGLPLLPGFDASINTSFDRYNTTLSLLDLFPQGEGYVATSISITPVSGGSISENAYTLVNNYIVINFLNTTYRGPVTISVHFEKGASPVMAYQERGGSYFPEFASHERTNIQYEVKVGEELPPGKYLIIYDSYGVA